MYRLEQQLGLLPRVFARALQECDRRDPGQKKAVGDRVKEIRADYLCKLHESNERLRKLNQLPHDLSQLDGVEIFQVIAIGLGMTDRAGAEVRRRKRKGTEKRRKTNTIPPAFSQISRGSTEGDAAALSPVTRLCEMPINTPLSLYLSLSLVFRYQASKLHRMHADNVCFFRVCARVQLRCDFNE